MAHFNISAPQPFLQTPGQPPIPWERWFGSFETYWLATGADDDDEVKPLRKRAILIHSLGTEGQRIFNSLEDTGTYESALQALERQFGQRRNVMMERWHFRHREQRAGETSREFIAALCELVTTCKFGGLMNEFVRDQLIEKTSHHRIRERLLMEPDTLTLERATNLAVQIEDAILDSKQLQNNPIENRTSVQSVKRTYNYRGIRHKQKPCANCGSTEHTHANNRCPARGLKCRKCGKTGHFAAVCRSGRQVKYIGIDAGDETNSTTPRPEEAIVFSVKTGTGKFKSCTVKVGLKPITLLLDIGAKVSILSETVYRTHFDSLSVSEPTQTLLGYGGNTLSMIGVVYLDVEYQGQTVKQFPFYVSKTGACLMGVDLFDELGLTVSRGGHPILTVETDSGTRTDQNAETTFGNIKKFIHKPRVNADVAPVSQKLQRLPLSVRDEVSKELNQLKEMGIIEPIDSSPWISNIVVARRKSGAIRICVDLKEVNKAIIPDKYPLPTVEELSAEFHSSTVISKLDLRRAYLQVPLAEESRYLTAFITHDGVYQYRRMPFGLSSSPSAFQKILSSILLNLKGTLNLIDDIVVHGKDQTEHDKRLNLVLERLREFNVNLNTEKCYFAKPEIEFLGYKVSARGVKFVPNYADKAEPLRKLLRKDVTWEWTNSQTNSQTNLFL